MDERRAMDHIHETLFSAQGIVDTLVGPLLFLVLFKTAGLDAAMIGAGAAALAVVALRWVRRQRLTSAWYGVLGVAVGVAIAKTTGSGSGYFIPKVASNALYGTAFLASVLIGKPLIGVVWAFFHRQPLSWGYRAEVRRVFSALTLMWASAYFFRAVVYGVLIADDQDRTGTLATVSVVLGFPLTVALVLITLLVIRRSLGPRARPPAAHEPLESPPHA
jgi:intracellular septation protein A